MRYIHSTSHTQALYFIGILHCAVPALLHMNAKDLENVHHLKLGIHWWSWWPTGTKLESRAMTLMTKIFFQHNLAFPEADTLLVPQNTQHSLVFSQFFTKLHRCWRPETAWTRHINPDECHEDVKSLHHHLLLELCAYSSGPAKNFVYTSPWVCALSPHQLIKCNLRMQPSSVVQRYRRQAESWRKVLGRSYCGISVLKEDL